MSPPDKKRKTSSTTRKEPSLKKHNKKPSLVLPPTTQSAITNPSLPDDVLVSCLALVSRVYYPSLSLVSKSFRSLLASPELYKTRSSIGHAESCLYVCLRFHPDPNPRWFTLCMKPDRVLTKDNIKKKKQKKKKSSGYVLAKIPASHSPPARSSGLVTIGSDIYNIGGDMNHEPSSSVSILDCRTHTWREGPSMLVKRIYTHANVLDGKIYVAGYGKAKESSSSDLMEVFDPKTQTWELVSRCSGGELGDISYIHSSAAIDRKVYIFAGSNDLAYEPRECRWERVGTKMTCVWSSNCVIENVLYQQNDGKFEWYDTNARLWRTLKGVVGLPKFARSTARLADYGGRMAVLWDKVVASPGDTKKVIWCAVIALERRNSDEIWGKVQWRDVVLTVPTSCDVQYALAATVC
ncbi:unnamed protein product [Microthlaspi erraticum]|uniref:F-box domain-containing protein n=1 Tax=Microthlaspi erraticum TaxID=1685480 RepID=A0A6D2HWG2_9BRAS|nr:unnamed protein product [Microthlaspi erraticum]